MRLLQLSVLWCLPVISAVATPLPAPTDPVFCQAAQKFLASTDVTSDNTLFTDMPSYRASKPSVDPLRTYQVVSYVGELPVMVSCKVKGTAHIRAAFGDDAAGEQKFCPDAARVHKQMAIDALRAAGDAEAAARVEAIVIDNTDWGYTGRNYLADFELSYVGEDGYIHVQSPGLYHDYDGWTTWVLPEILEGHQYCHIATPAYFMALGRAELPPGTLMTTGDDAPTAPIKP